jgi:hypothetical protein
LLPKQAGVPVDVQADGHSCFRLDDPAGGPDRGHFLLDVPAYDHGGQQQRRSLQRTQYLLRLRKLLRPLHLSGVADALRGH